MPFTTKEDRFVRHKIHVDAWSMVRERKVYSILLMRAKLPESKILSIAAGIVSFRTTQPLTLQSGPWHTAANDFHLIACRVQIDVVSNIRVLDSSSGRMIKWG